jgi:hypothetical protein
MQAQHYLDYLKEILSEDFIKSATSPTKSNSPKMSRKQMDDPLTPITSASNRLKKKEKDLNLPTPASTQKKVKATVLP